VTTDRISVSILLLEYLEWYKTIFGAKYDFHRFRVKCRFFVYFLSIFHTVPCTNGSHVQMVPMYKWFPCTNDSCVKMVPKCNMFAPSSPQCGMQYVCTKFPTMRDINILQSSLQCCISQFYNVLQVREFYAPTSPAPPSGVRPS
jgi:hypothetical protein